MNTFEWDENTPVTANNLNETQNIINGNITTSLANQYNLVTDGNAVKTGRQIDGKDEWVKRFSFTTTGNQDYTKPLGFTLSDVIVTEIKGTELSTANNWIDVSIGDFNNLTSQAQNIKLVNSNNTISLTSNNNCKLTIVNVYFIYRN
jgi:hypothetical protein